jgi:glutathione S-transferase
MYQLFWHPSSSSYAPLAVLEELGVPYRLHQVDYEGAKPKHLPTLSASLLD